MYKLRKRKQEDSHENNALKVLMDTPSIGRLTEEQRIEMTTSCRDTDDIPKVKNAGSIERVKGVEVQVLHNGIVVEKDGYVGPWMTKIIHELKGHHEPQEEVAFYEVLKRLHEGSTMIELGSYWAYYSLWFNKSIKDARNICCEPDPKNRKLGERNAALNGVHGVEFISAAAGSRHGEKVKISLDSDATQEVEVQVASIDGLVAEKKLKKIDILHLDVQGVELDVLEGARESIEDGRIRFIFVSTHHYIFSKSAKTHIDCLNFIKSLGGHIISSHTVPESFSGDGLIVASFSDEDRNFVVTTSINHTDRSLFRPYEEDLQILLDAYSSTKPQQ